MAIEVNLLPREMAPSKGAQKASLFLRKIVLALTGASLVIIIAGGGFYFFLFSSLSRMKLEEESLTGNIQSLQSTEASLVLLKDRLTKIQGVLGARVPESYFEKQSSILANAPEEITFGSSEVDANRSVLDIKTPKSQSLVSLMSILVGRDDLTSLILNEMSFSPFSGYQVKLEVF